MNSRSSLDSEVTNPPLISVSQCPPNSTAKITKQAIRTSLKASVIDGVFATIFYSITNGVLLVNFLLLLGATPVEIGLLSSIPMLVNFLQPLGAYLADRVGSRSWYILAIFAPSRLLWLILVAAIALLDYSPSHQLVMLTLVIILISDLLGAMGSCAWFSWMAVLVPRRLRGRYFGLRNSLSSLTNLLAVPLLGIVVSAWPNGSIQGYSVLLLFGVIIGIISLICQFWMVDVNPRASEVAEAVHQQVEDLSAQVLKPFSLFQDINFLKFLLYCGLWTFAINLSSPFFNLYLLQNLHLNLTTVTIYGSLLAGSNLLMLIVWGKLADRIGNRPLLLLMGLATAVTPLLWLFPKTDLISVWIGLPLIFLFSGGCSAATDLCKNNIQMELAPQVRPSQYFALTAAVTGVSGGLGAIVGGFIGQLEGMGGLLGLFAFSAIVRLIALLPLIFVQEPRSLPVAHVVEKFLPFKLKAEQISVEKLVA